MELLRSWEIGIEANLRDRCVAGTVSPMGRKRELNSRGVERLSERERGLGLDPTDDAARWLAEHDPPPKPAPPKSLGKSKVLHQWRRRQERR
jgi:hypothetical protein